MSVNPSTSKRASTRPIDNGAGLRLRFLGRAGGVAFLALAVGYGLVSGGHIHDTSAALSRIAGHLSGTIGFAAQDIRISELKWQSPKAVLAAIGVTPGDTLIGFDPGRARRLLENLDWVKTAHVQRLIPNQLDIRIVERQPFAIWQRDGRFYVIDEAGVALSSVSAHEVSDLLVVTGEGAQTTAAQLVNHLEAHSGLRSNLKAAARVGERRWTLYLNGGVKVLLPEREIDKALAVLSDLDSRHDLLAKKVGMIDLRVDGTMVVSPPASPEPDSVTKVSRR